MSNLTIRFHPARFWAATKMLSSEQQEALIDAVTFLVQVRDIEGLKQFGFIILDQTPVAA
jgi:hypothetical protein